MQIACAERSSSNKRELCLGSPFKVLLMHTILLSFFLFGFLAVKKRTNADIHTQYFSSDHELVIQCSYRSPYFSQIGLYLVFFIHLKVRTAPSLWQNPWKHLLVSFARHDLFTLHVAFFPSSLNSHRVNCVAVCVCVSVDIIVSIYSSGLIRNLVKFFFVSLYGW